MKKKLLGGFIAVAAAGILCGMVLYVPVVKVFAQVCAGVVMDVFKNTRTDYKEPVDLQAHTSGVTLTLDYVTREWNEVKIHYTLSFEDEIEGLIQGEEGSEYSTSGAFYGDTFSDCIININGIGLHGGASAINQGCGFTEDIWYYEVKDVSLDEHTLEQEIILYLGDGDYAEDINILLDYSNIRLGDKILVGDMTIEYTLEGGKYQGEIEAETLDLPTTSYNGTQFNITGYALTNTGLKIFADFVRGESEDWPITYLRVRDDLGNGYLFYPKFDGDKMTYSIYTDCLDGTNFLAHLSPRAGSLTMALYEATRYDEEIICTAEDFGPNYYDLYWEHYYETGIRISPEFSFDLTTGLCSVYTEMSYSELLDAPEGETFEFKIMKQQGLAQYTDLLKQTEYAEYINGSTPNCIQGARYRSNFYLIYENEYGAFWELILLKDGEQYLFVSTRQMNP